MVNKYYEKRINEAIDENFDIIRIDEGKAPYTKMRSRDGFSYSINLSAGEYKFSSWNKTGEQRNVFIDVLGEGTFNFGFMNLNNSSTSISIRADRSVTINMDIEMEGGEVNIEINAPGSSIDIEIDGSGTTRIDNISDYRISILINGKEIILEPFETYIWEG